MKKFLAFLLAAMLLLSVGAVAVADEEKVVDATIGKVVTITGTDAKMPAETFNFSITNKSVTDAADGVTSENMPKPTIASVTFDEGDTEAEKTISIKYPTYESVGIYSYTVKETAGNTAGMTYADNEYTLVVYVVNNDNGGVKVAGSKLEGVEGKKHDKFENKYDAGSLAVKKVVAGELGEKGKTFNFTVTFTQPEGKKAKSTISYAVGTATKTLTFTEGTATANISLKDGQTITFTNVPYTVSYNVTEDSAEKNEETGKIMNGDYVVTYDKCSGTISADTATATATVTNTKGGTIDTGITTDSLPYVMLLGFVILAGAALIIKRRVAHN